MPISDQDLLAILATSQVNLNPGLKHATNALVWLKSGGDKTQSGVQIQNQVLDPNHSELIQNRSPNDIRTSEQSTRANSDLHKIPDKAVSVGLPDNDGRKLILGQDIDQVLILGSEPWELTVQILRANYQMTENGISTPNMFLSQKVQFWTTSKGPPSTKVPSSGLVEQPTTHTKYPFAFVSSGCHQKGSRVDTNTFKGTYRWFSYVTLGQQNM